MTSDSAIPDLEPNSVPTKVEANSEIPNVESTSALTKVEENSSVDSNAAIANDHVDSNAQKPNNTEANAAIAKQEPNTSATNVESNSDALDLDSTESPLQEPTVNKNIQVNFKSEEGRLLLILPTESQVPSSEISWSDFWLQIKLRLRSGDRFWQANTIVYLISQDRLLDSRQLQEISEALAEVQLQLKSVATYRRQTAIAAVTSGYSVEQLQPEPSLSSSSTANPAPLAEALYLEMTVRSGVEIRHPGTVIILGDLNPGGIVVADGDILVWGRLRGIAHAGAGGNRECLIMALQMEPTQLRIADAVARAPEKSPMQFYPEVAYITPQGIRIARAADFSRNQLNQ